MNGRELQNRVIGEKSRRANIAKVEIKTPSWLGCFR
jgi:hypothetical protein